MSPLCKWLIAAGLGTGLGVFSSSTIFAADTAALAKRLHHAADASSLDDPALQPWHLKLAVQLYDAKGKPSEQGTIEEWWTPEKDKRVYDTPSYKATEIREGQAVYRTAGKATVPYLLNDLRERVVHPMATATEMDEAEPDLRTQSFGGVKLDCIMLDQPIKNVAYPPLGLFPTYCLDQSRDILRLSYRFGTESAVFNRMGSFQGRSVAVDTVIFQGVPKAVSGSVAALESRNFDPAVFNVGDEFTQHDGAPTRVSSGVMAGNILQKVQPIYPEDAKRAHVSGAVILSALIGTDGHIHQLRIVSTPDPSLAVSAIAAVRQWTYTPYLLKGVPVEVSTTVVVNYNFGRG